MSTVQKIIVLGGGPGGYVAAIRGAQLGAEVHIIEKNSFGGTCLNVGCIPTKALLHSAEIFENIKLAEKAGIEVGDVTVNWNKVIFNKNNIVKKLVGGVEGLLKANKVTIHKGFGVLKDQNSVIVDGKREIKADHIIIATGSYPVLVPFKGNDLDEVIDSTKALDLKIIPKSIVIVGGGVIGIEFAGLFSSLGCKVKVVELLQEILPTVDKDIIREIKKELLRSGVEFYNSSKLIEAKKENDILTAIVEQDGKTFTLDGEYILVAAGRAAAISNIGLEGLGVKIEKGKIRVDDRFATNIPNIYAIGDCNGKIMLAHAASAQGIAVVENALGHKSQYYANTIPSCIYTRPEIASVGLSEEQAKEKGLDIKVGIFNLAGNGKTLIENGGKGFIKFITGAKYGEVLGAHMIGPRATDMIAEAALAIRLEATIDEIISTIHPHPTVSEGIVEAALAVEKIAIHWPPEGM